MEDRDSGPDDRQDHYHVWKSVIKCVVCGRELTFSEKFERRWAADHADLWETED